MEQEIWLPIMGYEGLYEVSNLGRVKSLERLIPFTDLLNVRRLRLKKEFIKSIGNVKGYNSVNLSKEGKNITHRVCRLVAIAFINNPENKPCVNHISGIKNNDKVSNLEWVTHSENMTHAVSMGLCEKSKRTGFENPLSKQVKCLKTGIVYGSITEYSKANNIDGSNVSRFLSGKWKTNKHVEFYEG